MEAGEELDKNDCDTSELADETLHAETPDDEELTELVSTFNRQTVDKSELRRYLASLDDEEETLESLEEESLAALMRAGDTAACSRQQKDIAEHLSRC